MSRVRNRRVRSLCIGVETETTGQRRLAAQVQTLSASLQTAEERTRRLTAETVSLTQLNGTEAAPKARGYALVSARNCVLFFANDLPALPGGRVYQLWLIRDKSPAIVSAGVFEAEATTSAQVEFAQGDLVQGITAIAVTDEPVGGSASPTGHKLLAGLVKS